METLLLIWRWLTTCLMACIELVIVAGAVLWLSFVGLCFWALYCGRDPEAFVRGRKHKED